LFDGGISEYEISPGEFNLEAAELGDLTVSSSAESAALVRAALSGENRKAANLVTLNAGAAIFVSGVAATLADGIQMADDAIASGAALQKVAELVQFTELAAASGS
jgi:anthranilate phosphoribosyltransferase